MQQEHATVYWGVLDVSFSVHHAFVQWSRVRGSTVHLPCRQAVLLGHGSTILLPCRQAVLLVRGRTPHLGRLRRAQRASKRLPGVRHGARRGPAWLPVVRRPDPGFPVPTCRSSAVRPAAAKPAGLGRSAGQNPPAPLRPTCRGWPCDGSCSPAGSAPG